MLDPDRGAAISLATGDDASPDMIEGTDPPSEVADTPSEVAASSGASATETREPPQPPIPSEAAPPDGMLAATVRDERHARAHERHLHRGILAPSTHTPSCPCTSEWAACASTCLADEHGCIAACRREHHLCSRSCY